jgi:hypothetical protein
VVFDKNLPNTFKNVTIQVAFLFFLKEGGTMAVQLEDSLLNFSEDFKSQDLVEEEIKATGEVMLEGDKPGSVAFLAPNQRLFLLFDEDNNVAFELSLDTVRFLNDGEHQIVFQVIPYETEESFELVCSTGFFAQGDRLICETEFEEDESDFGIIYCEVMRQEDLKGQGLLDEPGVKEALGASPYLLVFEVE